LASSSSSSRSPSYPFALNEWKGTYNMGEECGESFLSGRTVTYDPCPPVLADGN